MAKTLITFKQECDTVVLNVLQILKDYPEWENRFNNYVDDINSNLETIRKKKLKQFNEWSPLFLYMSITEAKSGGKFSLRYLGQEVSILTIKDKSVYISTKKFDTKNSRDFGCNIRLDNVEWISKDATNFRKHFRNHFKTNQKRTMSKENKGNEEHRIESLLLTEFSKKDSKNKSFPNIQPVKLANIARFQMPTPLSASKKNIQKYIKKGGGIDILSRIKKGNTSKLCIMEVKDENVFNEPPSSAIKQGLSYATFIRQLLRSESGTKWWKMFGFQSKLPKNLELYVACVMPYNENLNEYNFGKQILQIENDTFQLHYLYFEEKNNNIMKIESSLKG